ncbi:outer membrane protein [Bartonella grahamii]|uniref:Porin n=2 Tax=Bartonella grahamii TaxID=33045 RepID=A0A336ND10_BARGR|nr:outer membrane protein [Bartonella grahamii]ACS50629.1 hemin binding protein B [Bartonella grahamii as4aup]SSZ40102.1 Opacity protein and related surface antigens [Bartonella grahamii]
MNTKRLITASIFSLISTSTALAADVMIPHQPAPSTSSAIVAPTFSWTGLYLGVQAGGFSSKSDMALVDQEKNLPLDKEFSPKLSGFVGGFYAGSNIDLGDNFIFGVDTDLMISGKKHTKTITIGAADNTTVENAVVRSRRSTKPQTSPTPPAPQVATGTPAPAPKAASGGSAGAGTPAASPASGTESSKQVTKSSEVRGTPTSAEGKTQAVTSKQTSSQTEGRSVQESSGSLARSDTRQPLVVVGGNGSNPVTPKPTAIGAGAGAAGQPSSSSLGRSDTGGASLGGVGRSQPSVQSASRSATVSVESAQVQPTLVKSSVTAPAVQPAAKAPTSVQSASQPSTAEKTVPSAPLVLARSGSSSEPAKASNGTSGAQNGAHHGAHGSGSDANPHGASHGGGHGSGAHAHGANPHASRSHGGQNMAGHGAQSTQAVDKNNSSVYGIEQMKRVASELGLDQEDEVETLNHTFKQNWGGATRVRIGFAADRFMPYLAGGIAYGQFQDTISISVKDEDGRVVSSKNLADETKTMIGYTLGGGVDFSVLDNVIVRAEYRYSDFGKKKFAKEKFEVNYKTNDFRVGVAYKF